MENPDRLYSNIRLIAPSGKELSLISRKRANWYIERGLAVWDSPILVKLTFEPRGYSTGDEDFYLGEKDNICVVCGTDEDLTKHHVVPTCFRRHFPDEFKAHLSHDVLLVCESCHEEYEFHAYSLKVKILNEAGLDNDVRKYRTRSRIYALAKTLCLYMDLMPAFKVGEMEDELKTLLRKDFIPQDLLEDLAEERPSRKDDWKRIVFKLENLQDFIRMWRVHFLEHAKPEHLPDGWSVDHRLTDGDREKTAV